MTMAEKPADGAQASKQENDKLSHPEGGVTTRDDALDSGAPMIQGDASEPVGPEDALGSGPKRGDYSKLIGNLQHAAAVVNPEPEPRPDQRPRTRRRVVLVDHQNPLVEQRGDEKGVKGGTNPLSDEVWFGGLDGVPDASMVSSRGFAIPHRAQELLTPYIVGTQIA
jgi:hypothetical protein